MRAQLLVATSLASGLILLGVACGTETVYVYEDAGATNATSSSSSSGRTSSSSSGKTSSSSGTSGDDDTTDDDTTDDDTTDDDDDSTGIDAGKDAGKDAGSSSGGFPTIASTKLVDGDDVVLLGIVGDDAIFRRFPAAAGNPSEIFAIPVAGGAETKLWDLGGQTDTQAISGLVIAHWTAVANSVGNLDVWSRASGLKTGIATNSIAGLIRGSADGSRIAFSQETVLAANKPQTTGIGIRGIGDAANIVTLNGAAGQVNLVSAQCAPQLSFVGQAFFAEFCNGTATTQNLARLVVLPAGSSTLGRIDAADLGSANTLAGNVRFSTNAAGTKVVAAALGGTTNTGKVYTVATPTTGIIDLEAFPNTVAGTVYTMTPDGTHVLYRMAPDPATPGDLKAAVVTASPATVKTLSSDVLALTSLALDGHSLTFRKLAPAASLTDINVVDFSVATPAPFAIFPDAKGVLLGFTGTSAQVVYLDGTPLPANPPLLKAAAVAGGAKKDLVTTGAPVGGRSTSGSAFVFFTNVINAAGGLPKMTDINFVDAANPQAPKKISSGVPLDPNDTELFVTGKKVVYTRLLPAGDEGIYTITLP